MKAAVAVLKEYFGFSEFRLNQEAIIRAVMQKKDVLALMPTGGGKSVCFQVPALLLDGLTVVISPLIALMKDQVDSLRLNGIEAAFLNSSQTQGEQEEIIEKLNTGKLKLLYLAPERITNFLPFLQNLNIALFAI
nr:DEAD/DEAH box helicase [Bacteroidia bacterium]